MKCQYQNSEPFSVGGLNRKDDAQYRDNYDAVFGKPTEELEPEEEPTEITTQKDPQ